MFLTHNFYIIYLKFREEITRKITTNSNNLNSLALLLEISKKTFSALSNSNITQ